MPKSKKPQRQALLVVSPLFRNSYRKHVVKSPGIEERLRVFKEFKQPRPPKVLPPGFHDHTLSGRLIGFRECHLADNILLIYTDKNDTVNLIVLCHHDDLKQRSFAQKLRIYLSQQ